MGGAADHGFLAVPPLGAEVGVRFHGGVVERPYYLGGAWGRGEPPVETRKSPPDNRGIATPTFSIELDETEGACRLKLSNRKTGDQMGMAHHRSSSTGTRGWTSIHSAARWASLAYLVRPVGVALGVESSQSPSVRSWPSASQASSTIQ